MTPAPRTVFVASLAHSGSTLLDMLLGCHPAIVGLGEVAAVVRIQRVEPARFEAARCSCGAPVTVCEFWRPAGDALAACDGTLSEKYEVLLASFAETFGDKVLVDSSKNTWALQALHDAGASPTVIHLVRDVRSWTQATRRRDAARGDARVSGAVRAHGVRGVLRFAKHRPTALFRFWRTANEKLRAAALERGLETLTVGYEEVAAGPVPVMNRIFSALGLDPCSQIAPRLSQSHVLFGNHMRTEDATRAAVSYDQRWLTERGWLLPSLVMPGVMRYNRERVYSNRDVMPWSVDSRR